jgi:hypothetical protein
VAKNRPNVSAALKRQLVDSAGGKCANPGCAAYRTHIHHIRQWSVYETHEEEDMVAICPTCHDAVHHGALEIDDKTVRRWKGIERDETHRDHVYVEPGGKPKLLLGTIAVSGDGGVTVFELGDSNELSFRLEDGDIMLLNLAVSTTSGTEVLRVVDGHVRHEAEDPVRYEQVPGHIRLTAPLRDEFMPGWAVDRLRQHEPDFAADDRATLLDLEVLAPSLVRVQGVWNQDADHVVAITTRSLSFLRTDLKGPLGIIGHGAESVLHYTGPITSAMLSGKRPDPDWLRRQLQILCLRSRPGCRIHRHQPVERLGCSPAGLYRWNLIETIAHCLGRSDGGPNGNAWLTTGEILGSPLEAGMAVVFGAAGTYTVGVKFKATSGSVTAKERKLWVATVG